MSRKLKRLALTNPIDTLTSIPLLPPSNILQMLQVSKTQCSIWVQKTKAEHFEYWFWRTIERYLTQSPTKLGEWKGVYSWRVSEEQYNKAKIIMFNVSQSAGSQIQTARPLPYMTCLCFFHRKNIRKLRSPFFLLLSNDSFNWYWSIQHTFVTEHSSLCIH